MLTCIKHCSTHISKKHRKSRKMNICSNIKIWSWPWSYFWRPHLSVNLENLETSSFNKNSLVSKACVQCAQDSIIILWPNKTFASSQFGGNYDSQINSGLTCHCPIFKNLRTSTYLRLISTEGALRLPTTNDNHPSNPSPSHPTPHIAVKTTSPLKI